MSDAEVIKGLEKI